MKTVLKAFVILLSLPGIVVGVLWTALEIGFYFGVDVTEKLFNKEQIKEK